ncbi:MAG: cell division protein ZapA [Lachnospiraceae bacterium]
MSSKNNTEVIIGGKVFTLSGYESEEYLQKVATFINNKINECKTSDGFKRLPVDTQAVMIHLNVADEYFKVKKQADALQSDIESKDKEIYDLKHDLIALQIKLDSYVQELKELRSENGTYQKSIVKLESEIDEMRK